MDRVGIASARLNKIWMIEFGGHWTRHDTHHPNQIWRSRWALLLGGCNCGWSWLFYWKGFFFFLRIVLLIIA